MENFIASFTTKVLDVARHKLNGVAMSIDKDRVCLKNSCVLRGAASDILLPSDPVQTTIEFVKWGANDPTAPFHTMFHLDVGRGATAVRIEISARDIPNLLEFISVNYPDTITQFAECTAKMVKSRIETNNK
jgi:hypothetical protein